MSSNYFTKASITTPAENIVCILAPNPSPMTFKGTNTYIIDNGELAIIDPGPINEEHFDNILIDEFNSLKLSKSYCKPKNYIA